MVHQYYSAIKINKLLVHSMIRINFKCIMLSERNQTQNAI